MTKEIDQEQIMFDMETCLSLYIFFFLEIVMQFYPQCFVLEQLHQPDTVVIAFIRGRLKYSYNKNGQCADELGDSHVLFDVK